MELLAPSLKWVLNWESGWSLTLALNSYLDKSLLHSATQFPSLPAMGLDWISHPKHASDRHLPPGLCPDYEMLWFPLPFASEIIWAMSSLAAEAVGVRKLRGESRSVGHPRNILYGVWSPWLLEQPELQSHRERAWQVIEHTAWHHRCSMTSWAQHDIMGTASRVWQSMMSTALTSSYPENTDRHLREKRKAS